MFGRKRPVVQLTSLLDLLFIMIFIALTTPTKPPEPPPPVPEPPISAEPDPTALLEELEELEAENAALAAMNDPLTPAESPRDAIGEYRKLFVANVYYKHGATGYKYLESILYSADEQSGLYEYRINLTATQVIKIEDQPLTEADADRVKVCDKVAITRDKIYQDCRMVFKRRKIIDCDRIDASNYYCREQLIRFTRDDKQRVGNWEYRLELVKIYDDDLVM
jgi:hypothetical protein